MIHDIIGGCAWMHVCTKDRWAEHSVGADWSDNSHGMLHPPGLRTVHVCRLYVIHVSGDFDLVQREKAAASYVDRAIRPLASLSACCATVCLPSACCDPLAEDMHAL